MSENFKNIDKVFRSQLRDYSQNAPEDVWGNIDVALKKGSNAKIFPFYKVAVAVAAIVVIGSGLFFLSNNTSPLNSTLTIAENTLEESTHDNEVVSVPLNENKRIIDEDETVINKNKSKTESIFSAKNNNQVFSDEEMQAVVFVNNRDEQKINKLSQKQIDISTQNVSLAIIDKSEQNINSYLNTLPNFNSTYALNDMIEVEKPKKNKWLVGGEFTPLYSYRNITSTSGMYDEDFYNRAESPIMSYTGGLNLQFKAMERLTVQAGVYYTSMGQALDYMSVYANSSFELVDAKYQDRLLNSYSIENSSGQILFTSSHVIIDNKSDRIVNFSASKAVVDVNNTNFNGQNAEVEQNFQYVEVPVLLRYTLIDKNINFNILGGIGANFLVGNSVSLNYLGGKEIIGETEGVSPVNYNGTLGVGIDYPIMKRINIRLEPSIKYYLNELNSNSPVESHPYSVGIYTGINYSF